MCKEAEKYPEYGENQSKETGPKVIQMTEKVKKILKQLYSYISYI